MKVTRRSDRRKGGHLLISVPAYRVAEVEVALQFLKTQRQKRGSQVVRAACAHRSAQRLSWRSTCGRVRLAVA
jgi:hypothetical protein